MLVPVCGLLKGMGKLQNDGIASGRANDLHAYGKACARQTTRDGNRRQTGDVERRRIAHSRQNIIRPRVRNRRWRNGKRRGDQRVHRLKRFSGGSTDLSEVPARLDVGGSSHISTQSYPSERQRLVKFWGFGNEFAVVRKCLGGPYDVSQGLHRVCR